MKKLLSLVLSVFLVCSIVTPSLAVDSSKRTTITQFSYIILDADGNIKDTGITPDLSTKASWSGIVLENGETAILQKEDGSNFYALKGTRVNYGITKNRTGNAIVQFINTRNSSAGDGLVLNETIIPGLQGSSSMTIPTSPAIVGSDYYCLSVKNASSDPITITNAYLTF